MQKNIKLTDMKKTILTLMLCLSCLAAGATQQVNDKVTIDREVWEMPHSPLEYLQPQLSDAFRALLGERNFINTSNYRGYIAFWYVRRGCLYLDRIEVPQQSGEYRTLDIKDLKKTFRKYRRFGKIRAGWLTGDINVGNGIGQFDPTAPFAPSFAKNRVWTLKKGRIVKISE